LIASAVRSLRRKTEDNMPLKRIGATATPPVHRFSAIQGPLRDDWFGQIETKFDWIELGPIGEGESQSLIPIPHQSDLTM